jgi:hypothetical protein
MLQLVALFFSRLLGGILLENAYDLSALRIHKGFPLRQASTSTCSWLAKIQTRP